MQVDKANHQRVIRALEMCIATGKTYSSFRVRQQTKRPFNIIKIGISMPRDVLYQRINSRVEEMIKQGLEEEARNLFPFKNLNALQTVGYSEWFDYLDGQNTREEAIERIKQNTRRYAKKQMTWFTKDTSIHWFTPTQFPEIKEWLAAQLHTQ